MARKGGKASVQAVTNVSGGEIVPEGDFAGLRVDEVLRLTCDAVHEALGGVTIEAAGAALDMAVGEYLSVVQQVNGDRSAKESAIRLCETAMPYVVIELPSDRPYAQLRKREK